MRKVRYCVAVSSDGFIAGPKGECDWITMDPEVDFEDFFRAFDTVLLGRATYLITQQSSGPMMPGMKTIVCSRTLNHQDYPDVTIVDNAVLFVEKLKREQGKDIWLFGGGGLFRSLLDAHLVDTIELGVMPIILSQGIPLLPEGKRSPRLHLDECRPLSSGTVGLTYTVQYADSKS